MKELSIRRQNGVNISIEDVIKFEEEYEINLPKFFKAFIVKYSGKYPIERIFINRYDIVNFLQLYPNNSPASCIKNVIDSHFFHDVYGFFPFAIASPGWDYNFSLREETYGQIWINRQEDDYETAEECFQFVANNLEEFINGLEREEDLPDW